MRIIIRTKNIKYLSMENNSMGDTPNNFGVLLDETINQLCHVPMIFVSINIVNYNVITGPVQHFESIHEEEHYGK